MNPELIQPPICGPEVPPPCIVIEPCSAFNTCIPQPVPTLETWGLIGLLVVMCAIGLVWIWKRRYD